MRVECGKLIIEAGYGLLQLLSSLKMKKYWHARKCIVFFIMVCFTFYFFLLQFYGILMRLPGSFTNENHIQIIMIRGINVSFSDSKNCTDISRYLVYFSTHCIIWYVHIQVSYVVCFSNN